MRFHLTWIIGLVSLLVACGSLSDDVATGSQSSDYSGGPTLTLPPVALTVEADARPGTCEPSRVVVELATTSGLFKDIILRPEYDDGCTRPEPDRYYPLQLTGVECGSRIYRGFWRERRPTISAMYHLRVVDHSGRGSHCEPADGVKVVEMGPTGQLILSTAPGPDTVSDF